MDYNIEVLLSEIATLPEFTNKRLNVNSTGIFGNYPIHAVCTWQDHNAVKALLANGADINSVGERGETPIFRPVRDGNKEFILFLIQLGAKTRIRNVEGVTPYDIALNEGFDDIADLLASSQE